MQKKILVVDDDAALKETIQILLELDGHSVEIACDGETAINKFKEINPDVMFLDIKMPEMDGYQVFFKIIKDHPDAKIVFMTGFSPDVKKHQEAEKMKLFDTITKPVARETYQKIIASVN